LRVDIIEMTGNRRCAFEIIAIVWSGDSGLDSR